MIRTKCNSVSLGAVLSLCGALTLGCARQPCKKASTAPWTPPSDLIAITSTASMVSIALPKDFVVQSDTLQTFVAAPASKGAHRLVLPLSLSFMASKAEIRPPDRATDVRKAAINGCEIISYDEMTNGGLITVHETVARLREGVWVRASLAASFRDADKSPELLAHIVRSIRDVPSSHSDAGHPPRGLQ